jgi:hypothetical protein
LRPQALAGGSHHFELRPRSKIPSPFFNPIKSAQTPLYTGNKKLKEAEALQGLRTKKLLGLAHFSRTYFVEGKKTQENSDKAWRDGTIAIPAGPRTGNSSPKSTPALPKTPSIHRQNLTLRTSR